MCLPPDLLFMVVAVQDTTQLTVTRGDKVPSLAYLICVAESMLGKLLQIKAN